MAKELRNPAIIDLPNPSEGSEKRSSVSRAAQQQPVNIYWGSVWHMQTPLDNIEQGSYIAIEYRAIPTAPGSQNAASAVATFPLDIDSIDSGSQTLQLLPNADASSGNPIMTKIEKASIQLNIVLNKRNREIDVKVLYGT